MSITLFQDNIFPRHISDLMNLMHMMVFNGTDGEEHWDTYLDLRQKECVALALAQYYQCDHCITQHLKAAKKLGKTETSTLQKNINSIILFLRIDTRTISDSEKQHWINAWKRFAHNIATSSDDTAIPYLIGLAIGIARNDEFLMDFCGNDMKQILKDQNIEVRPAIGELESIVIFMKAAASKNRVAEKLDVMFGELD